MGKTYENIWERLENIDPRIFYVIALIVLAFPLLQPLGLPTAMDERLLVYWDIMENIIPDDAVVLVDFSPGSSPGPAGTTTAEARNRALIEHLFRKPWKLIFATWTAGGYPMQEWYFNTYIDAYGLKTYGDEWVWLGYIAGDEPAIKLVAEDIRGAFGGVDAFGNSLADMECMEGVFDITDVDWFIQTACEMQLLDAFIRQFITAYDVNAMTVNTGPCDASMQPYYDPYTGIWKALVIDVYHAAGYELLLGKPGLGVQQTDSLSLAQTWALIVLFMANIAWFMRRQRR
jgi:hypothetical protein